jgi:hypothetical protein
MSSSPPVELAGFFLSSLQGRIGAPPVVHLAPPQAKLACKSAWRKPFGQVPQM